jgi:hypothetical protein
MYKVMQNGQVLGSYATIEAANAAIVALKEQGQTGLSISIG